jgi:hypothetical protein
VKNRPAVVLRVMPQYGDLLVCGISFDETIQPGDPDFVGGAIGAICPDRHQRLLDRLPRHIASPSERKWSVSDGAAHQHSVEAAIAHRMRITSPTSSPRVWAKKVKAASRLPRESALGGCGPHVTRPTS